MAIGLKQEQNRPGAREQRTAVISRTWHGATPLAHKEGFTEYEYQTSVREALALPGCRGAFLRVVEQGELAHFFLCTLWEDYAAMCAFAGPEPEVAVCYPEDAEYGLISDPIVIIQEVTDARDPFSGRQLQI